MFYTTQTCRIKTHIANISPFVKEMSDSNPWRLILSEFFHKTSSQLVEIARSLKSTKIDRRPEQLFHFLNFLLNSEMQEIYQSLAGDENGSKFCLLADIIHLFYS